MRSSLLLLSGVAGGFGLAKSFIDANRELENMKVQLNSLLDSDQAGAQAFDWVKKFQEANPVRTIQEYSESFKDLVAAGIDPTTGALKDLTVGAVKFGLTQADVGGVTRAIKQMLAVSNAQKQELNQLSERIPGVQKKIAEALGKTSEQFKNEMKQQKIASVDVVNAVFKVLGKGGDEVISRFANTWDAGMNRLKTAWFNLLTAIGGTGIFDDFKSVVDRVASFITTHTTEIKQTVKALYDFTREILDSMLSGKFIADSAALLRNMVVYMGSLVTIGSNFAKILIEATKQVLTMVASINAAFADAVAVKARQEKYGILSAFGLDEDTEKKLKDRLNILKTSIETVQREISEGAYDDYKGVMGGLKNELDDANQSVRAWKKEMRETQALLGSSGVSGVDIDAFGVFDRLGDHALDSAKALKKLEDTMRGVESQMRDREANTMLTNLFGEDAEIKGKLDDVGQAYKDAIRNMNESTVSEDIPTTFVQGWSKALEETRDKFDKEFAGMAGVGKAFSKTLTDSLSSGFDKFFGELIDGHIPNLKSAINGFLQDILKGMLKLQSQKLSMQIAGGLADFATSAFGGGASTQLIPKSGYNDAFSSALSASTGAKSKGSQSSVQIINQSGIPMQATTARVKGNRGDEIMTVVMDAVGRNKGGSRDALRGLLG